MRSLVATAKAGNTAALALCFKLHEAYESARWELIDDLIERLNDPAAAAASDELLDILRSQLEQSQ